jgi:hypothetical protein
VTSAGTAYVEIRGDFGPLTQQLRAAQSAFGQGFKQMKSTAGKTFGAINTSATGSTKAVQGLGAAGQTLTRVGGPANDAAKAVGQLSQQATGAETSLSQVDGAPLQTITPPADAAAGALDQVGQRASDAGTSLAGVDGAPLGTIEAPADAAAGALGQVDQSAQGITSSLEGVDASGATGAFSSIGDQAGAAADALSAIDDKTQSATGSLSSLDTQAKDSAGALGTVEQRADTAGGSIGQMRGRMVQAARQASQTSRAHLRVGESFRGIGQSARRLAGGLLVAVSAYRAFSAAKNAVSTTTDLAKATLSLSRNTGLDIRQSSRWVAAMKARGASAQTLNTSFTTLSKNVVKSADAIRKAREAGEAIRGLRKGATEDQRQLIDVASSATAGSSKQLSAIAALTKAHGGLSKVQSGLLKNALKSGSAAEKENEAFAKLGITQKDIIEGTRDFDGFLGKVARGFGNLRGGVDRAALAQKLFGRNSKDLVSVFSQGNKSLQDQLKLADKYHITFGGKSVKSIKDLIAVERELKFAQLGLQVQFTQLVAPALTKGLAGVNEFARKVGATLSDPKFTSEERWNKIGDMISDKISQALPKIADAAGRIAPKVAVGFVRGFIHADIWGKLAVGAFLVSKLVGWGVIFRGLGARIVGAFASTFLPTMTASGEAGGAGAARGATLATPAFAAAGAEAGRAYGAAFRATSATSTIPSPVGRAPTPVPTGKTPAPVPAPTKPGKLAGLGRLAASLVIPATLAIEAAPAFKKLDKEVKQHFGKGGVVGDFFRETFTKVIPSDLKLEGPLGKLGKKVGGLFGGGKSGKEETFEKTKDVFKDQAVSIRQTRTAIGQLGEAQARLPKTLSPVVSAQKRVNELQAQGKTGTRAYAVAVRNLDAAEAQRLRAKSQVVALEGRARQGAQRDVAQAGRALSIARQQTKDASTLAPYIHRVAQARSREAAATLNVSRGLRGLNPLTGDAATKMGVLAKQLKGLPDFGSFRKLLVTADVSQAQAAVRVVTKLKDLGRSKTALKIIADSKSPEEALRRLRRLLRELEEKRHRVLVEAKDEATRKLDRIISKVRHLPIGKVTVDVVGGKMSIAAKLEREVAEALQRAGRGAGAKQLRFRAKGGAVQEALTMVGEEGPELAKLPGGQMAMLGQQGPEFQSLPIGTRVYSHPETKRKLPALTQKVVQRLIPASIRRPKPLVQQLVQETFKKGGTVKAAVAKKVGASQFGGPRDPSTGHVGKYGELRGTDSYAELDYGSALGRLPARHPLRITYKGHSVVARKRDIGAGGGAVRGRHRAIDLWHETARKLRFPHGTDLVTVEPVKKAQRRVQPRAAAVEKLARGGLVGTESGGESPRPLSSRAGEWLPRPRLVGLARRMGIPGFARGGWVRDTMPPPPERKEKRRKGKPKAQASQRAPLDSVQEAFSGAWSAMAPRLPEEARGRPSLVIRPAKYPARARGGGRKVWWPSWLSGPLLGIGERDEGLERYARNTLVHELVHSAQSAETLSERPLAEGGAVNFAELFTAPILKGAGLHYAGTTPFNDPTYLGWAAEAAKRGLGWIKEGQFTGQHFLFPAKAVAKLTKRGDKRRGGGDSNDPGRRIARSSQLAGVSVTPAEVTSIVNRWGVNRAVASIGAAVKDKFPAMNIISGYFGRENARTRSGSRSNHAIHAALDLGSKGALNRRIGTWVRANFPNSLRGVTEGVLDIDHDPNPPDHADHVHVAALGAKALAKVMEQGADGVGKIGKPRVFRRLSLGQYVSVAKRVGFPDPALAAAIFYAESMGKVNAVGDSGESLGAAQIHTPSHPRYDHKKLRDDVFYNFRAALDISKHGKSFEPWTQYRNAAYKQFLRAKAVPLPKGTSKTPSGDKYTDYLQMKMLDAEGTPSLRDDYRWINRAMRYWRGVVKRNRRAGNSARVVEGLNELKTLRETKKDLRTPAEDEALEDAFTLGGLETIGTGPNAFRISGMQRVLDQIELEKAQASLTVPPDDDDSISALSRSLQDDIAAVAKLVSIRESLYTLVSGFWQAFPKPTGVFTPSKDQEKQLNRTKSQPERIALLKSMIERWQNPGTWIIGTVKQKIDAATDLGTAREELKNLRDEAGGKTEAVEAEPKPDASQDVPGFLSVITDLIKQYASNVRPVQAFARGGVLRSFVSGLSKTAPALVGEKGFELAKLPGGQRTLLGHQGPEIRELPVGTRVFPHSESKRIIEKVGIPAFAQGGVIQPVATDRESTALTQAIVRLEQRIKEMEGGKTVNFDNTFNEVRKEDAHGLAKAWEFEARAAV